MLRKRIGVMVPSTNTTLEADFQLIAPPTVTIHGQRLWLTNEANGDAAYERMNGEIESGARYLATARVDVVAYGCTTGSFYRGSGWGPGDAGDPAGGRRCAGRGHESGGRRGLAHVRRAAPLRGDSLSGVEQSAAPAVLRGNGFRGAHLDGEPIAAASGNQGINDQEPESVVEFATRMCRPQADALLCSCTAWRALEAVDPIEQKLGKPVVTSNQATIWAAFRAIGVDPRIRGYGRLLERLSG